MAASWPSKREAAVTMRTLNLGLYGGICSIKRKYFSTNIREYGYCILGRFVKAKMKHKTIIIGAGISGLSAAHFLQKKKKIF